MKGFSRCFVPRGKASVSDVPMIYLYVGDESVNFFLFLTAAAQ